MTTVRLFKDIGLSMSLKKSIDFAGSTPSIIKQNQTSWFNSRIDTTVTDVAFNKLQNLLHLPMDYGDALEFTYVRFDDLDDSGRYYYYFIANVTLVDDSTVAFQLVLDSLQTFMGEWSLEECMVNRAHVDRWGSGSYPIYTTPCNDSITTIRKVVNQNLYYDDGKYAGWAGGQMDNPIFTVGILYIRETTDTIDSLSLAFVPVVYSEDVTQGIQLYVGTDDTWQIAPPEERFFNNTIAGMLGVTVEQIVSIFIMPKTPFTITGSSRFENMQTQIRYAYVLEGGNLRYDNGFVKVDSNEEALNTPKQFDVAFDRPVKPSNNASKSPTYEPMLYEYPYTVRRILSSSSGIVSDIPDNILFDDYNMYWFFSFSPSFQGIIIVFTTETIPTTTLLRPDNYADIISEANANGLMFTYQFDAIDIISNDWLNYALTKRDTDRQIINNQNWQNAINNLLFMGYGGALVGSRGGGLVKDDIPILDNNRKGPPNVLGFRRGLNPALGGAVGLAAGASIISSLVDAHFAWENQNLKEQQIRNQPATITMVGNSGLFNIHSLQGVPSIVEQRCDDDTYETAYNNFFNYGYELNKFMKLDIRSRKFFNYVLTNGAIISGSIVQSVKDEIAMIFDNGITIFHMDYASSTDYDDITQENIERSLM